MSLDEGNLIFFYDDSPVGYFQEAEYPTKVGDYRYMPFRGFGHYEMQEKLRDTGSALCHYDIDKKRVFFTVGKSDYGILRLSNFEYKFV